jgi:hypothetical protein
MIAGRLSPSPSPFALALLVTLAALPLRAALGASRADDAEAEARRRFGHGKQLFDEHKYREAAQEFEAGYAVVPKPGFLLNIGHSYRRAGELEKARHYYQLFLEKDKDKASAAQRAEVQGYLKAIDKAIDDEVAGEHEHERESRPPPPAPAEPAPARASHPVEIMRAPSESPPASPEPLAMEVCSERPAAASSSRWPWIVTAVAVVGAGIAAAVALTRGGSSEACGTLGCVRER